MKQMHPQGGRLEDLGILDLLKHDDRPTFILLADASHFSEYLNTQIVFRNHALDTYVRDCANEFECWARTLSIENADKANWTFGGRAWANTVIQGRWIVVYCSQVDLSPAELLTGRVHEAPPAQHVRHDSEAGDPMELTVPGDTNRAQGMVPRFPSLINGESTDPKIMDWTKHYIAELPPYIQFIKRYDWTKTQLGPISAWPDALRRYVVSAFNHPDPRIILWGEQLLMLYNEAAVSRIGHRHPIALGRPASETFAELWPQVSHIIRPAIFEGISTKIVQELYFMERNGISEETYWNFVMSPLMGDDGYALGVLDTFTEQTYTVIAKRRRDMITNLAQVVGQASSLKELWARFLEGLEAESVDVPYAILYSADDGESSNSSSSESAPGTKYVLAGTLGIQADDNCTPVSFDLADAIPKSNTLASACQYVSRLEQAVILRSDDGSLPSSLSGSIPGRGWGDAVTHVCVMPVALSSSGPLGYLILALNPRRPCNDESVRFSHSLRDVLAKPASIISRQRFEELNDSLAHQLRASTLEAAHSEERFAKLAESSPIGICTFGHDGRVIYVNNEYLSLIGVPRGYDSKKLWDSGNNWQQEILPEDIPRIQAAWETLMNRSATTVTVEYRMKRPWLSTDKATGNEIAGETWLLNKASAEVDEEDNVLFIHAWLLDVSAQHLSENLMAQRLNDALQNKRQSENFIDMVSHELRNPLSAILQSADGILTVLDEVSGDSITNSHGSRESILESAQTIVLCAQHQKCIVDDILTLSKLDSNLLVITPDRVQPPSLIEKVLKMYEAELVGKKIEARLEVEASFTEILHNNDYVMLDPSRLLQVVINLLTNAIKFTQYMDERKITIYLSASHSIPSGSTHDLAFIAPRTLRHEHSTGLSTEWGNGQDLYLQLTVQDTGRGLGEEEMKLLFQRFSQASPKTYKQYGGSGLGLFISRELTELQGGQIGVSSKGVGKGSTFAFYVRARRVVEEVVGAPSPVALQHIWNTPVSIPNANDRVIQAATLVSERPRLSRVPTKRKSSPKAVTSSPDTQSKRLHVLVVEDNLINQKVMVQQLRRVGCVVHVANHGLECLDFLQNTLHWNRASMSPITTGDVTPRETSISVILMDWEMPTMDGLTCVREIRKLEASGQIMSHIPVIAVTANARGQQISVAMDAGMDDLVTKPFRIPDLLPVMESLVARYPTPSH